MNDPLALHGGCHCGNLSLSFVPTHALAELPSRACMCTFCRPRRIRWTADPAGRVEISIGDARELSRYRFGTGTADFLICRRCGYVVAAVSDEVEPRAVINIDVLARADEFVSPTPKDFDTEDVESRRARRAANWTPAVVR
jgi:hypothetical protein